LVDWIGLEKERTATTWLLCR